MTIYTSVAKEKGRPTLTHSLKNKQLSTRMWTAHSRRKIIMSINHNIAALNTHRQLGAANRRTSKINGETIFRSSY